MTELSLNVSIKVPDIDSIFFTSTDNKTVVDRAEHDVLYWISVANESLEEERKSFSSFIIPNFDHAVLSSRQQVSTVV